MTIPAWPCRDKNSPAPRGGGKDDGSMMSIQEWGRWWSLAPSPLFLWLENLFVPNWTTLLRNWSTVSQLHCVESLSHGQLFTTSRTVAARLLCSWGCSRQEHWSGLPVPSSGELPDSRDQTRVSCITGGFCTSLATREAHKSTIHQ